MQQIEKMTLNKKIWLSWKTKKPCPSCSIGTLSIHNRNDVLKTETGSSKEMNSHDGCCYSSEYVISIHMKCNNCNEVVAVTGFMSTENYPRDEEKEIQNSFTPILFYPALKIIHIPASCPNNVQKILNETFGLFWLDLGSCANKIRIVIEVLLNEQGVSQTKPTKKGDVELSLHKRLKLFEKTNPDTANHLMAIKWIGNAGSHFSEIKNHDILDAYMLLEYSLEKLYNDREIKLIQLSEQINIIRKPRKK